MEGLFYLLVVIGSWIVAAILGASLANFAVLVARFVEWLGALISLFKEQGEKSAECVPRAREKLARQERA